MNIYCKLYSTLSYLLPFNYDWKKIDVSSSVFLLKHNPSFIYAFAKPIFTTNNLVTSNLSLNHTSYLVYLICLSTIYVSLFEFLFSSLIYTFSFIVCYFLF
jgi:hypothetical protein